MANICPWSGLTLHFTKGFLVCNKTDCLCRDSDSEDLGTLTIVEPKLIECDICHKMTNEKEIVKAESFDNDTGTIELNICLNHEEVETQ